VAKQAHHDWDLGCSRVEDITHSLIVGMEENMVPLQSEDPTHQQE